MSRNFIKANKETNNERATRIDEEQKTQNNEITTSIIANTEIFEMVLDIMLNGIYRENEINGGNAMVEVYVTLILKGQKVIDQVPLLIREQVQEQLDLLTK